MWGILALDRGFELLCGGPAIGRRRHLDASTVSALRGSQNATLVFSPYRSRRRGFWRWGVTFMAGSMATAGT